MFQKGAEGNYEIIGKKKDGLLECMDAGLYTYKLTRSMFGNTEELIPVTRYKNSRIPKQGTFVEATNHFEKFFDKDYCELRGKMGMVNKLNVIFNGKPGTGKTHLACVLAEKYIRENNAVAIVFDDIEDIKFADLIDRIRVNDPGRMIIIILDELEKNASWMLKKSHFLGYLDGPGSRENVITIGTTNSIDDFPNYLRNRKGRFEKFYDFEFEGNAEAIRDTAVNLVEDLEGSELLEIVVKVALAENIGTVDDLRFMIIEIMYADRKGNLEEFMSGLNIKVEAPKVEFEKNATADDVAVSIIEKISSSIKKGGIEEGRKTAAVLLDSVKNLDVNAGPVFVDMDPSEFSDSADEEESIESRKELLNMKKEASVALASLKSIGELIEG